MYGPEEQGYARLWATVLSLVVNDIRSYARKHEVDLGNVESIRGLDAGRAAAWLMSDEARNGGFRWVCDVLDLSYEFVRNNVLIKKEK